MFLKNNYLLILSFTILLLILGYNTYEEIQRNNLAKNHWEISYNMCFHLEHPISPDKYEFCYRVLNTERPHPDFYTTFTNIVIFGYNRIVIFLFLFITVPSIFYVGSYLKNNSLPNSLTRKRYSRSILDIFKKSYISALILPVIIIIGFIISIIIGKTFDPSYSIAYTTIRWTESTMSSPILFISLYLLAMFMYSFICINIGLCVLRKVNSVWITAILSFLVFVGIQVILEIVVNRLFFSVILNSELGHIINITNPFSFNDDFGLLRLVGIQFILTVISFIAVWLSYGNKESLLTDCREKK